MYAIIGISIYMAIGMLIGLWAINNTIKIIEEYRNREYIPENEVEEDKLYEIKMIIDTVGQTKLSIATFFMCAIFWLPMLILKPDKIGR